MAESSTPPKKIQNLRSFTVQIRHVKTGEIVGTGFVVSHDGLIATCAHVVVAAGVNPRFGRIPSQWELIRDSFFPSKEALQSDRTATVTIYFPQARVKEQRRQKAIVVGCFQDWDDDSVLLKLQAETLPDGVGIALVDTAEDSAGYAEQRLFRSYGYRRLSNYRGLPAEGTILDFCECPSDCQLRCEPLVLRSSEIDSGMSGAAVLDVVRDRVVGIIAETSDIRTGADRDTSFAVDYAVVKLLHLNAPSAISSQEGGTTSSIPISPSLSTVKPVVLSSDPYPKKRIDLSRAPALVDEWVGRETFLAALSQDWNNPQCHLTGVIGFGGEGKSTLARQWIENLQQDAELPQVDGVFWWGFYEQPNTEEFFNAVLNYLDLGNLDPGQLTSVEAKAQIIRAMRGRYLFILDGLEILQEQEGDDYGLLKNRDLRTFLRIFADGNHTSFCLLTSRFPVLDLIDYTTYQHREIGSLDVGAGCQLLRKLGIRGSEKELAAVVNDWGGYALSLRWVATYLLDKHQGNVKRVREIPSPDQNQPVYNRLQKVLRSYDGYLTQAEREFLKVFSLFRLPVVAGDALKQVFEDKQSGFIPPRQPRLDPITKLLRMLKKFWNWVLRRKRSSLVRLREKLDVPVSQLSSPNFNRMIRRLVDYRIVYDYPESHYFTLHPLIRTHYLTQLTQTNSAWSKAIRQRIGDFYQKAFVPKHPTLSDLTPLIEAVYHFCQAGNYDEAYKIVWERINQRDRFVLTRSLGAYDISLTLMREFFPEGDITQTPDVSKLRNQGWILNETGYCLMSLGRLAASLSFFQRSAETNIRAEDWHNAYINFCNLADSYIWLGDLNASATADQSALIYAHRTKNQRDRRGSLAYQGRLAHLQGNLDTAQTAFQQAELLEQQIDSHKQFLYSTRGIWHADHLRCRGDAAYARRITEANRIICEQECWKADLSQCERFLGDLDADANLPTAQSHYDASVQMARRISNQSVLIEALLARGRWSARQGDAAAAAIDLKEALGYTLDGSYRIYEADTRIGLAWMHRTAGNLSMAQQEAIQAQRMSQEMGYHWGQVDAAEVLAALESGRNQA